MRERVIDVVRSAGRITLSEMGRKTSHLLSSAERQELMRAMVSDGTLKAEVSREGARGPARTYYSIGDISEWGADQFAVSDGNGRLSSGLKIGGVSILEKRPLIKGARQWLCRCDCQPTVERELSSDRVRSGHCGCQSDLRAELGGVGQAQLAFYERIIEHRHARSFMDLV